MNHTTTKKRGLFLLGNFLKKEFYNLKTIFDKFLMKNNYLKICFENMFFLEQIWGSVDFYGVFLTTIKNLDKFFYIIYKCTTPSRISWEKSFYIYKFLNRIFLNFFLKKLKITFRNYSKKLFSSKGTLGFFWNKHIC